jgi:hypothetical protein
MVAFPLAQRLNLALAPLAGGVFGALVAAGLLTVPVNTLESLVMASGIPAVFSAAEAPLGFTARAVVALAAGTTVGVATWFVIYFLIGMRSVTMPRLAEPVATKEQDLPILRRADAHPDAPARRPVLATRDLGTPFLEVRAKTKAKAEPAPKPPEAQPIPADLDAPLSAYDPTAIPVFAAEPVRPVAPLFKKPAPLRDPAERIETFELTPAVRPAPRIADWYPGPSTPKPIAAPRTDATIHALLDRLERGVARREAAAPPPPPPSLQDTLAELRKMATRA